jgi:formyl-CoA transferase
LNRRPQFRGDAQSTIPVKLLRAAMWAVQGIPAALNERHHTGKGRLVECSLLETAIGFSSWTSAQWLADHEEPTRQGSRHRQNAPYQRMQTKDGYLMVGAAGEAIWARCAKALGPGMMAGISISHRLERRRRSMSQSARRGAIGR